MLEMPTFSELANILSPLGSAAAPKLALSQCVPSQRAMRSKVAVCLSIAILAVSLSAHRGMASDDVFEPLRLYSGIWLVRPANRSSAESPDRLQDLCLQVGSYFTCQQTKNGKLGALLIFVAAGEPDHYHTQAVLPEGQATGRGDLKIEGNRWIYSSKEQTDGKTVYYRTINQFTGKDRIHYEQAQSFDGEHWSISSSGDEVRTAE